MRASGYHVFGSSTTNRARNEMKKIVTTTLAAMLVAGCATAPSVSTYGAAGPNQGPYQTASVNRFPEPDRPAPEDTGFGQSAPDVYPPYQPMSVNGPPPAAMVAGEVMKGVVKTLAIVGLSALSGQSFSIGGGRIYGNAYVY